MPPITRLSAGFVFQNKVSINRALKHFNTIFDTTQNVQNLLGSNITSQQLICFSLTCLILKYVFILPHDMS